MRLRVTFLCTPLCVYECACVHVRIRVCVSQAYSPYPHSSANISSHELQRKASSSECFWHQRNVEKRIQHATSLSADKQRKITVEDERCQFLPTPPLPPPATLFLFTIEDTFFFYFTLNSGRKCRTKQTLERKGKVSKFHFEQKVISSNQAD